MNAETTKVPPIKTQGIKTKLVPFIKESILWSGKGQWVEPFLGSGVVLFNIAPERALVADTNKHIINFFNSVKDKTIDSKLTRDFLQEHGDILLKRGEEYYYEVRQRFNATGSSLDFLFLNRSCFNGLMRFNRKGGFNVPFCRKDERFRPAYITKICNQVKYVEQVVANKDWVFVCQDWRKTLERLTKNDIVYADPPYAGRFNDYLNAWDEKDSVELETRLKDLPCSFLYSMWAENKYRKNNNLYESFKGYNIKIKPHFYHLGATESLRNSMKEALVVR